MDQQRTQLWASGGGVQSAAIAALIVQGKLKPDLCIIVDTEREQSTTWTYMDEVITPALATIGVTLARVAKSAYASTDLYAGRQGKSLLVPAFTNQSGSVGKMSNFCSSHWKREIVKRWANAKGVKAVDLWLGISVDEMRRVQKTKSGKWQTRYPLIEQRLNRGDCIALVKSMGWPEPPRSSCYHCPNHTQQEWREIRLRPADWGAAVKLDKQIRANDPHVFLHNDCVPLEEADLADSNGVLFSHDCQSGHCFT